MYVIGFELICGKAVPSEGPEWHELRSGSLAFPETLPQPVAQLISTMMGEMPDARPTAAQCLQEHFLKSKLEQEIEKLKAHIAKFDDKGGKIHLNN